MRQKQNRSVTTMKVLSVLVLVLMVFSLVWIKTTITRLEYKMSSLEKARSEALKEQKTLVAQKAQLMALTRVEQSDLAGLGFTFPERTRVVYVKGTEQTPYKVSYNAN